LFALVAQAVGARSLDALRPRLQAHGVLWSTYQTLLSALRNDARLAPVAPLFETLTHPSGLSYPAPGAAADLAGLPRAAVQRAPHLGEHTDEVLAEVLSLSPARIGALHDAGLIAQARD
jgi:2-methylfumaryl-CoA isomerase